MRINSAIIKKVERSSKETALMPSMQISKSNSANEADKYSFKPAECLLDQQFIFDEKNIIIRYLGDEDFIEEYTGIEAVARLGGSNRIKIFIPKSAMNLLCTIWEIAK